MSWRCKRESQTDDQGGLLVQLGLLRRNGIPVRYISAIERVGLQWKYRTSDYGYAFVYVVPCIEDVLHPRR